MPGIKVNAVAASEHYTLAVADDGRVYSWGDEHAAKWGSLGLGLALRFAAKAVPTPRRFPALLVAYGNSVEEEDIQTSSA